MDRGIEIKQKTKSLYKHYFTIEYNILHYNSSRSLRMDEVLDAGIIAKSHFLKNCHFTSYKE